VSRNPDLLALRHALDVCLTHREGLNDALTDLDERNLSESAIGKLSKADRRLLDQFAYRYTRLQDDMGQRLLPAVLRALGEDVASLPAIDRFNRLEQLGWLPSADEWVDLRRIRNEFTHEYPETTQERFERLQLAFESARRLIKILGLFREKANERYTDL
jgi:hypothetical protein